MNQIARLLLLLFSFLPAGYAVLGTLRLINRADQLSTDRIAIEVGLVLLAAVIAGLCGYGIYLLSKQLPVKAATTPVFKPLQGSFSKIKFLAIALLLLALFGFGIYLAYLKSDSLRLALFTVALMAVAIGSSAVLPELMRPGPSLRIDERGLYHYRFGLIPWPAIVGLRRHEAENSGAKVSTLIVGMEHPHLYIANANWLLRLIRWRSLRDKPEYGVLRFVISGLGLDPSLVEQTCKHYRSQSSPPAVDYWHEWQTASQIADRRREKQLLSDMDRMIDQKKSARASNHEELERELSWLTAEMQEIASRVRADAKSRSASTKRFLWLGYAVAAAVLILIALKILVIAR